MKLQDAITTLGLPSDWELSGLHSYREAMGKWKTLITRARLEEDDTTAKILSQVKSCLNYHARKICRSCGGAKSAGSERCQMCESGGRAIPIEAAPEIEDTVEIPYTHRKQGKLQQALARLLKVGDSVVVSYRDGAAISKAAKVRGIQVMSRTIAENKRRVWRTDGLTLEAVNEIIRKRTQLQISA